MEWGRRGHDGWLEAAERVAPARLPDPFASFGSSDGVVADHPEHAEADHQTGEARAGDGPKAPSEEKTHCAAG